MQKQIASGNQTLNDFTGLLSAVSKISPSAADAVAKMKNGTITAEEGFATLNEEIDIYLENLRKLAAQDLNKAMRNYQLPEAIKAQAEYIDWLVQIRDS